MERHDVPGVEGAFVLTNVLTPDECERLAAQSEVRCVSQLSHTHTRVRRGGLTIDGLRPQYRAAAAGDGLLESTTHAGATEEDALECQRGVDRLRRLTGAHLRALSRSSAAAGGLGRPVWRQRYAYIPPRVTLSHRWPQRAFTRRSVDDAACTTWTRYVH